MKQQIWKEIKEIKTKLTEEQQKNNQLRDENQRLREAVKIRNRKIKELSNGNTSRGILGNNRTRISVTSLDTDDTISPENEEKKEEKSGFSDWMSSITCSLKAKKCNWF